jgi:hypothetical protein
MFSKEKTKKIVIVVLFLIAVIGLVGYGVYSVEYENGTFISETSIEVGAFNPQTVVGDTAQFLGDGGFVSITCPTVTDEEFVNCTGSMTIKNNGDGPIVVELIESDPDDEYSATGFSGSNESISVTADDPVFSWSSKVLAAKETAILNITIPVQIESDYNSNEEVAYNNSYSYEGTSETLSLTFKLRAYQYLGE